MAEKGKSAQGKPNILVIFGDDIGTWNVGAYTHGMMGRTPSIDRIAKEGMLFTDHYGAAELHRGPRGVHHGTAAVRTGMTTIGIPGSTRGIQKADPTLAEVLKTQGYATGQFGKNHLGDRNEFLPTVHGFDEWFGNLYHLNAEEEPEELDYPGQKNPEYLKKYGPARRAARVGHRRGRSRPTDPKFGRVGKQKIENTGPLTRKRMETFDAEVLGKTLKWLDSVRRRATSRSSAGSTRRRFTSTRTRPKKYIQMAVDEGRGEEDVVRAKMIEHDEQVGALLKKLDDLGVADNTIVVYTTDNGNELMLWPDGGYAPFRGEKGTHLGRRRARADARQVARQDQARQRLQRHPEPRRRLRHARRGGGSAGPQEGAARRQEDGRHDLQGPPRRLQQPRPLDRREREVRPPRNLLLRRDRPHGRCAWTAGRCTSA